MFRTWLCRYFGSFPLFFRLFPLIPPIPISRFPICPFSPEWTTETCRIRYASASVQLPPQNSASGSGSQYEFESETILDHLNIIGFSNSKIVQSRRQVELFWFMAHCIRQIQNAFTNTRGPQVAAVAVCAPSPPAPTSPLPNALVYWLLCTLQQVKSKTQRPQIEQQRVAQILLGGGGGGLKCRGKVSPTCHSLEIREQSPLNWLRNLPDRLCWPKAKVMEMIS